MTIDQIHRLFKVYEELLRYETRQDLVEFYENKKHELILALIPLIKDL